MSDIDVLTCRTALADSIAAAISRGAKAEVLDFVDPYRYEGPEALEARERIDQDRAETAAALAAGESNPESLRNGDDAAGWGPWLGLRKSAMALHPLYEAGTWDTMGAGVTWADFERPFSWGVTPTQELERVVGPESAALIRGRYRAFLEVPADDAPLTYFRGSLDAAAVRSRAAAAALLVTERSERWSEPIRIASLACGAAKPIARMAAGLQAQRHEIAALTLIDRDPMALAAGRCVAERGSEDVPVHALLSDLLDLREMRAIDLRAALEGQRQDVIEMLGLFEYLPDPLAIDLLRRAGDALAPGGLVVFANMLAPRPEQDVFSNVIQWPAVIQRSPSRILDLVEAAGFSTKSTAIVVPESEMIYQIVAIDPSR